MYRLRLFARGTVKLYEKHTTNATGWRILIPSALSVKLIASTMPFVSPCEFFVCAYYSYYYNGNFKTSIMNGSPLFTIIREQRTLKLHNTCVAVIDITFKGSTCQLLALGPETQFIFKGSIYCRYLCTSDDIRHE